MVLKYFYTDFCISTVYQFYKIVLNLNDFLLECNAANLDLRPLIFKDGGTNILYNQFQIMVFNKSNIKVLEQATIVISINKFLKSLHIS